MTGRAENRKQRTEEFGQARLEGSKEEIGSLQKKKRKTRDDFTAALVF